MKKSKPAEWKKKAVKELEKEIANYKVVAIANLTSLPSYQLQKMRSKLKGNAVILGSRINLMRFALSNLKDKIKGVEKLNEHFQGVATLVLTNESAFMLSKRLAESKTAAPAKAGQIAPKDIIIPAGPTQYPPGPIISDLGKVGLITGVENGKVAIKKEKILTKKGEEVSKDVANVLSKLKIEPMELGINLTAAYEDGVIFTADILSIDEKEFMRKLQTAATDAYALTIGIGYVTKDNIEYLLSKAYRESILLADTQDIMTSENIAKILGKAEIQAKAIKEKVPVTPQEIKEEKSEDKPEDKKMEDETKQEAPKEEPVKVEEPQPAEPEPMEPAEPSQPEPQPEEPQEEVKEEEPVEEIKEEPVKEEPTKDQKDNKDVQRESEVAQDILKQLQDRKIEEGRQ